jgi:signal transduction histidine kinase/CheY-like chemotaxis protein
MKAPLPDDEAARLQCLRSLEVLDTSPDPALDAITQALAAQLGCPIALVSLVDAERQWFKSKAGIETTETSRDLAFCAHAILGDGLFVVRDALADPRFADNPLVTARPSIRFYAGVPLRVSGQAVGTLCAIDNKPRILSVAEAETLRHLARAAEACLVRDAQLRRVSLSEARLADFANASSDFLWECDALGCLTWTSAHAGAEPGLNVAPLAGATLWNGVLLDTMGQPHPQARTLHEALADGLPFARRSIETDTASGKRVLSLSGVPVQGAGGARIGWRGSVRDVTSTVNAQRSLREQDERLQRIARHVPGVLYQFERSANGRMRLPYVSEGIQWVCELTPSEVARDASALFARMHPDDLSSVQERLVESARTLEPWRDEFRVVLPGRGLRWLEGHATPVAKEAGGVVWHGFVADVTKRRADDEALDLARRRLQLAIDAAGMGIVQIDPVAGTIELDQRALDAHAQPNDDGELELWRWLQWVDAADRHPLQEALSKAMSGAGPLRVVYGVYGEDVRRVELVVSSQDRHGRLLGVCRDVSEQERAEEALNQAGAAEQRRHEEVQFLSRVSHELRTPMNAILGFAQLLSEDTSAPLEGYQRRWLDQVQRGGQHLLALVEDVLSLASADAAVHRLVLAPQRLQRLMQECLELLEPLAIAAEVRFESQGTESDLRVLVDRRALRQVLVNVLGNAVKYNRRGGKVTIVARADAGVCVIEACDDGPGIPRERLKRLFVPFERLGAENGSVPGTGLGLSIAKGLTEAMDGSIEANCPAHGGTCVRITLPLAPANADLGPETTPAAVDCLPNVPESALGAARFRRAVYVEDNEVNALLMATVFEQHSSWALRVFDDAADALAHIRAHRPELVLLDLNLAGLSGMELLRLLRDDPRTSGLHCIAVSADSQAETVEAALAAGFDDFWAKPLNLNLVTGWLAGEPRS